MIWSEEKQQQLCEKYETHSVKELAKIFNVTPQAIRNKAWRLGITKNRQWTERQIQKVKDAYLLAGERGVVDLATLSKQIGKSKPNICRKARQLALPTSQNRFKSKESERRNGKPKSKAKYASKSERSLAQSANLKARHRENGHPMKGKNHSSEALKKISAASKRTWAKMSEDQRADFIMKAAKGRAKTPNRNREKASWKAGWREIGGKRNYYRSRWEANYGRYLEWLKQRGEIRDWEHEPETFWFDAIKRGVRSYKPDFRVWENDGSSKLHEVKGWMDQRSRTTLKRMAKYHPDQEIVLIDGPAYRKIRLAVMPLIPGWEDSQRDSHA